MWGIDNALVYVAKETAPTAPNDNDAKAAPTSRVVGAAFWLPPHAKSETMSWSAYYQNWMMKIRQLLINVRFLGRGGLLVNRYWIWKAGQEKAHGEVWTDPRGYYFCNTVAVMPDSHGKGIGRKLVDVVTDQADRNGMSCYLESSKSDPNIKIYERFGFKLAREVDCDDNGTTCRVSSPRGSPRFST